jgi:4-hydroxybenzoyl-CoA thioesterase
LRSVKAQMEGAVEELRGWWRARGRDAARLGPPGGPTAGAPGPRRAPGAPMLRGSLALPVRWSESDPAGIAFYPRFFEWFDVATGALFAAIGEPWHRAFRDRGIVGVPVVEASATFHAPVRFGDEMTIESEVTDITDKTFRIDHRISVAGRRPGAPATMCATGWERRAWVPRPSGPTGRLRAGPIPADVRAKLAGH